jgi:hypothetical protein
LLAWNLCITLSSSRKKPTELQNLLLGANIVGCTNRIKRLSVGINDWILTEDLSTNK